MCLSPLKILNRKKQLNIYRGDNLYLQIPCGHCSECKDDKRCEYFARSYAEYKRCIDKNGFTYWDTLTFNDEHLPHVNGIPCFNREYITNFKKRLFINIKRFRFVESRSFVGYNKYHAPIFSYSYKQKDGKDWYPFEYFTADQLRLYITSEFGETYHRPHHHVIFYCTVPGMTPYILYDIIKKSWSRYSYKKGDYVQIGFTDRSYRVADRVVHGNGVINYVSKYVVKDDHFIKEFNKKLRKYQKHHPSKEDEKEFNRVFRKYHPFHTQSLGFGNAIITQTPAAELFSGHCRVPDALLPYRLVRLPQYITRKLFYKLSTNDDGSKSWVLNEDGIKFKLNKLDDTIQHLSDKYFEIFNNTASLGIGVNLNGKYFYNEFNRLLAGRSFKDFAKYVVCYKDKMLSDQIVDLPNYKWFYELYLRNRSGDDYFYNHFVDENIRYCMRPDVYEDEDGNFSTRLNPDGSTHYVRYRYLCPHIVHRNYKSDIVTLKTLKSKYIIDENRFPQFKDFDKLYDMIYWFMKPYNRSKNEVPKITDSILNNLFT